MKIGDKLLKLGYLNKKQLKDALAEQSQQKIIYNKDLQLGQILVDKKFLTLDELTEGLSLAIEEEAKEEKIMPKPTEIGESSKFTFDLKFLITMGAVIVSGCGIYFTMNSAIAELKSNNSPSRLEYEVLHNEITSIKNAGNLDVITYKLQDYDETFKELKELTKTLSPLASDLDYLKKELNILKNKEIKVPEIDLSGITESIEQLSNDINSVKDTIDDYKERIEIIEKLGGGRF
tara:strand:+ start:1601 stop:2302 length:702 start_codon:yes stop_codon:yes gene_type:complete